jgi:hypothetical protein
MSEMTDAAFGKECDTFGVGDEVDGTAVTLIYDRPRPFVGERSGARHRLGRRERRVETQPWEHRPGCFYGSSDRLTADRISMSSEHVAKVIPGNFCTPLGATLTIEVAEAGARGRCPAACRMRSSSGLVARSPIRRHRLRLLTP